MRRSQTQAPLDSNTSSTSTGSRRRSYTSFIDLPKPVSCLDWITEEEEEEKLKRQQHEKEPSVDLDLTLLDPTSKLEDIESREHLPNPDSIGISSILEGANSYNDTFISNELTTNSNYTSPDSTSSIGGFQNMPNSQSSEKAPKKDEEEDGITNFIDKENLPIPSLPTSNRNNKTYPVHKPLKDLILQTNKLIYDVDSTKITFKVGLSKKQGRNLPSLHKR
ncbi:Hed1p NDAI_0A05920 [Naumovozyma dairenensis CBS 421]|uniref:Uncharacterized protein n=1 Tax=Naumovozyma dairenensis (strain ATCC 10597 / BCRC 20456 / CBS 421 / NBRC 0211 / NRRL Y-12639) TaxID=1071378 RepID=G0W4K9_NAUDC|nr:hypothetical protein NDAI_0A05920 [Naumovozyma dairenensis CBS 421]CCD22747.1 hypothetical protein NDAI_0A05920 [Naumovozyma dairenensis CBS 421]